MDHAATSWPKPPTVIQAITAAMEAPITSSGRGSHSMALSAGRILLETRMKIAELFHVKNENQIVFTANTTEALNLAIKGFLKSGDHVITTMLEHNSVRRPLEFLQRTQGVMVDYVEVDEEGHLDLEKVHAAFKPNTKMLICCHSSNLLGSILPIGDLAQIAHQHGAVIAVDVAQTAGIYPIDVQQLGIDLLAFPGHKGLLGPQGTGGLYIAPHIELQPLIHGGTGSQSEEREQPKVLPDRYEAGTINTAGIAGLKAGIEFVLSYGVGNLYEHEWKLTQLIMEKLKEIPNISLLGPQIGKPRTGIVSFNLLNKDASEVAFQLDRFHQIAVRAGYHCTPLAHQSAHTAHKGAVRVSVGYNTTEDDISRLVQAVKCIEAGEQSY